MNDLGVAGVRLDAARRQFYIASQKHIRENVAKKDNTSAAMPKEENDPKMTGANLCVHLLSGSLRGNTGADDVRAPQNKGVKLCYVVRMCPQCHTALEHVSRHGRLGHTCAMCEWHGAIRGTVHDDR